MIASNEVKTGEFLPSLKEIKPFSVVEAKLAEMKRVSTKTVFDYASPKGNKEARSHVHAIRLIRGDLERVRKETKAQALEFGRMVDSEAKRIESELESMIEVHAAPLREIEEKEEKRKAKHEFYIQSQREWAEHTDGLTAEELHQRIEILDAQDIGPHLEEYEKEAVNVIAQSREKLVAKLSARVQYESEQAELVRLRELAAENERKEQERAAKERAEKAEQERIANEQRIAREAEERAIQQERERAAEELRNREAEAARLQQEAESRERNLKAEAERARRQAEEAEERAKRAEQEAIDRAERIRKQQAEEDRIAAQKREANKKHKAAINNAAVDALEQGGIPRLDAVQVVTMIARGQIPHITISY